MAAVRYKKSTKIVNELEVGDKVRVCGLICEVMQTLEVFHYVPKANVRISVQLITKDKRKKAESVIFLPSGQLIETLKEA